MAQASQYTLVHDHVKTSLFACFNMVFAWHMVCATIMVYNERMQPVQEATKDSDDTTCSRMGEMGLGHSDVFWVFFCFIRATILTSKIETEPCY